MEHLKNYQKRLDNKPMDINRNLELSDRNFNCLNENI